MKTSFIYLAAALILSVVVGCDKKKEFITAEGSIWHTGFHVSYESDKDLSDSIIAELGKVERSVSVFTPSSLVCAVNAAEESCAVDAIFEKVYNASVSIWKESGGYFDPTLSPLINAYGFGKDKTPRESLEQAETDSILAFVGIDKTRLEGGKIVKQHPLIQFNFSAIAKGYGCDAVGEMLKRNGCGNYMVEIGGEVAVAGQSPSGKDWQIQIDKPVFSADTIVHEAQEVIAVTDCGIATSGNYRNYRIDENGNKYGHTFDPHTGKPAVTDLLSATVVMPTCMEADGYATACMAMGFEKAREMATKLGLKVMLVAGTGEVWSSDGFKQLIVK